MSESILKVEPIVFPIILDKEGKSEVRNQKHVFFPQPIF